MPKGKMMFRKTDVKRAFEAAEEARRESQC